MPKYGVAGRRLSSSIKGGFAAVGWNAITAPSVPRLTHAYSASNFLFLFRFSHFPKIVF